MSAAMTKRMLEEAIVRRDQELSFGRETPVVVVAANEAQARLLRRRLAAMGPPGISVDAIDDYVTHRDGAIEFVDQRALGGLARWWSNHGMDTLEWNVYAVLCDFNWVVGDGYSETFYRNRWHNGQRRAGLLLTCRDLLLSQGFPVTNPKSGWMIYFNAVRAALLLDGILPWPETNPRRPTQIELHETLRAFELFSELYTMTTTTKPPEIWISAINDDRGIVLARTPNEELVAQVYQKTCHDRLAQARGEAAEATWNPPTAIDFMIPDPPSPVLTAKYRHSAVALLVRFDSSGNPMELGRCSDNDFACEMLDKIFELG